MKALPRVSRLYREFSILGLISLCSLACTSTPEDAGPDVAASGGSGQTGGSANGGGSAGMSGAAPIPLGQGGRKLRVLTQSEYMNALTFLFQGPISAKLELPANLSIAGYTTIGASQTAINAPAVVLYETASLTAAAEVFADSARWQKIVGCQPQADLSDPCVVTFIQTFGKRAFRRELSAEEVQVWLTIGKEAAQLSGSAARGLETIVSGILQSPFFLYRVETNLLDTVSGRLKYDGPSMATRLAFLLTGSPPDDSLLAAGATGQLDTAEGVKAAAATLMNNPNAIDRMANFFNEFSQADLVMVVPKSPEMFPSWNTNLQNSMLQATQLFIKNIVLAPGADVRSFFDSPETYVDANLAPIYGVTPPMSGFQKITLAADSGRAGILGQAAVLAGHSQPDHNSPTRRGVFISDAFLCLTPPPPPDGVPTELPQDPTKTERQRLDLHRTNDSCKGCHALFDPLGFGLEHFDSIGQYRATEHGLTIDATGTVDGIPFDGAAQMGAAFRQSAKAMRCMMTNFYRAANGRLDDEADGAQIDALGQTLAAKGYVWRDLVAEFVASDAFRSAPAAPVTAGNQ